MAATGSTKYEDDEFEDDDQNQEDDDLDELLGSNQVYGTEGEEEFGGEEDDSEDGEDDLDDLLGSAHAAPEKERKGKRLGDVMKELMSAPITPGKCPILSAPIGKKAEKRKRDSLKEAIEKRKRSKVKKLLTDKEHVQPQFDHIERRLLQVATKGVVALFNAVAKHQKEATMAGFDALSITSAKTMDTKVSSLSKDSFLDMIKRSQQKPKIQDDDGGGATWEALDTGYLLGKTRTKNWNEEDDEEDGDEEDEENENEEQDDVDNEPDDEDQDNDENEEDDDDFDEKAALQERESDDEEGENAPTDDFMSGLADDDGFEEEDDDDDDDDDNSED
uniref:RRP15-like protein n=2 Tax=Lotharella globosa TaxID=91324 RepID=A0A7S4DRD1_9EUKA|mmetsp:Transcript_30508/g.58808  ORF Transcript_30508/g.58808 Transcript_30508/m.58808 type:complete len:333 (-) Transcript_30508:190-1188(-)